VAKQTQRAGAPNGAKRPNGQRPNELRPNEQRPNELRPNEAPRKAPLPAPTFNRTERTLTFMVAGVLGVSLIAFIMLIVAWLTVGHIPSNSIWQVATALPLVGFPIGMLLIFALLGVVWTRKARENRNGTR
jgi:uncharacterized membrane protein YdbT with pleckstrin-like domain